MYIYYNNNKLINYIFVSILLFIGLYISSVRVYKPIEKRFDDRQVGVGRHEKMVHQICGRPPRFSNYGLTTLSKKFYISKFGNGITL